MSTNVSAEVVDADEGVTLLDLIRSGEIERPGRMRFADWLAWRARAGRRPIVRRDGRGTTGRVEANLYHAVMADVHGEAAADEMEADDEDEDEELVPAAREASAPQPQPQSAATNVDRGAGVFGDDTRREVFPALMEGPGPEGEGQNGGGQTPRGANGGSQGRSPLGSPKGGAQDEKCRRALAPLAVKSCVAVWLARLIPKGSRTLSIRPVSSDSPRHWRCLVSRMIRSTWKCCI